MNRGGWQVGDWAIYKKSKHGAKPTPRAKELHPAEKGNDYSYVVDKYWIVIEVGEEQLHLRTRKGKVHLVSYSDPALSKPKWWQRWLLKRRFEAVIESLGSSD